MRDYQAYDHEGSLRSDELTETTMSEPAHTEVGGAAAELARSLPELVEQLKRLRVEMEKCSKVYDAITANQRESRAAANDHSMVDPRMSSFAGERGDSYSNKRGSGRDPFDGAMGEYDPTYGPATNLRQSILVRPSSHRVPRQSLRISTTMPHVHVDYTVMWVSGECGISLRNFSTNKIGAQIAVLQQADGVTTGISNCRLSDQLVTVNDERVDEMRFRDIVGKLKSTRRPITLGFRTNQNIQTSPTAGGRPMSRNSARGFVPADEDYRGSMRSTGGEKFFGTDVSAVDRQTTSSMRSSTSTLSDDVEIWCKEQEEMHSDIIVLLTETVMRCEKLQQENLDQLQNLMQLAPSSDADCVSSSSFSSSLAPIASPADVELKKIATTSA